MDDRLEWFIGIMSGTSLDGVDCVAVAFDATGRIQHMLTDYAEFTAELVHQLHQLASAQTFAVDQIATIHQQLGHFYSQSVGRILKKLHGFAKVNALPSSTVTAVGCHGQTIRHMPLAPTRFTWQLGAPHSICQQHRLVVCYDFRRMDLAVGGQGAPLAPLFHQHYFLTRTKQSLVILNLGGIANVTILGKHPYACDTGPANTLLDRWIARHRAEFKYDHDGQWGRQGTLDEPLLAKLLEHPYFKLAAPKSTGPETFHISWIDEQIAALGRSILPVDVQMTLHHLTAASIAAHLNSAQGQQVGFEILVCGGGSDNSLLLDLIGRYLPNCSIASTLTRNIDPHFLEACAFAWLARQRFYSIALDGRAFTGAKEAAILGSMILPLSEDSM